jgi:drug/metabolite transporter (DMT)-like permease
LEKKSRIISTLALLTAMIFWSSSFIALKLSFQSFDPVIVIFGRMFVASLCFLFLYRWLRGSMYRKGDWKYLLAMALFEPCFYFVFEMMALVRTTASQAGMITAIFPVMVAIGAALFLGESIRKKTIAGFILAAAGAVWLSLSSDTSDYAPNPLLGNTLEFFAMICGAGYTLIMKKLSARYNPFFLTAFQAFTGSIFFFPMLFFPSTAIPESLEPMPIFLILYLGIFVTLVAYGLFNFGVSRIPTNQAIAFVNLMPVLAVFLAWLILDETFNMHQYAASVLVIAGVIISQEWRQKEIIEPPIY